MSQVDLSRVNGKYHLVSQENYEEYLKAIGRFLFFMLLYLFCTCIMYVVRLNINSSPLYRLIHNIYNISKQGLNVAKRALAMNEKTHIDCHVDGDDWSIEIKGMRDAAFKFRLGVEAKRTTADGRHVTVQLFKTQLHSIA